VLERDEQPWEDERVRRPKRMNARPDDGRDDGDGEVPALPCQATDGPMIVRLARGAAGGEALEGFMAHYCDTFDEAKKILAAAEARDLDYIFIRSTRTGGEKGKKVTYLLELFVEPLGGEEG